LQGSRAYGFPRAPLLPSFSTGDSKESRLRFFCGSRPPFYLLAHLPAKCPFRLFPEQPQILNFTFFPLRHFRLKFRELAGLHISSTATRHSVLPFNPAERIRPFLNVDGEAAPLSRYRLFYDEQPFRLLDLDTADRISAQDVGGVSFPFLRSPALLAPLFLLSQ